MKAKKIVAVILLVAGIGLAGMGIYQSYFIEEQATCGKYLSDAKSKSNLAQAAAGTPKEAALKEEASIAMSGAESVCGYARQSRQTGMLMLSGGLISIIVSVVLLVVSRRASRRSEDSLAVS
jgi:hypothetical protein